MGKLPLTENYTFFYNSPSNYIITELEIQIDKFSLLKNNHKEILKNNEIIPLFSQYFYKRFYETRMIITSRIDD